MEPQNRLSTWNTTPEPCLNNISVLFGLLIKNMTTSSWGLLTVKGHLGGGAIAAGGLLERGGPEEKEGIEGEYRPCMCVHNPAGKGKERGTVCHKDKLSHRALGWKKLQLPFATPEGCVSKAVPRDVWPRNGSSSQEAGQDRTEESRYSRHDGSAPSCNPSTQEAGAGELL